MWSQRPHSRQSLTSEEVPPRTKERVWTLHSPDTKPLSLKEFFINTVIKKSPKQFQKKFLWGQKKSKCLPSRNIRLLKVTQSRSKLQNQLFPCLSLFSEAACFRCCFLKHVFVLRTAGKTETHRLSQTEVDVQKIASGNLRFLNKQQLIYLSQRLNDSLEETLTL